MTLDQRGSRLARGDEMWRKLSSALDERLHEPVGPGTDWTGHDVYAHFARWQQESIDTARALLAGVSPAEAAEHEDVLNMRWREEDRDLATDVVRERCLRTRDELRSILLELDDGKWAAWGEAVADDINGGHYAHHLAAIGETR